MSQAYILAGTENEYLLVIRIEDKKSVYKIIDELSESKVLFIQELAIELEKSLHDDGNRRNSSEARPKNKSKAAISNNSKRRKTKDS